MRQIWLYDFTWSLPCATSFIYLAWIKPCLHALLSPWSQQLSTSTTASDSPPCGCTAQTYPQCPGSHRRTYLAGRGMWHWHCGTASTNSGTKSMIVKKCTNPNFMIINSAAFKLWSQTVVSFRSKAEHCRPATSILWGFHATEFALVIHRNKL